MSRIGTGKDCTRSVADYSNGEVSKDIRCMHMRMMQVYGHINAHAHAHTYTHTS